GEPGSIARKRQVHPCQPGRPARSRATRCRRAQDDDLRTSVLRLVPLCGTQLRSGSVPWAAVVCGSHSELDRIIGLAALGAAGAFHVRVVRIDIAATMATEDAVLRR